MKILMTGATGLIGKQLSEKLVEKGHQLIIVSRNADKARKICKFNCDIIEADLNLGPIVDKRIDSIDAVIHLAGESVAANRWTEAAKKNIYNSRVLGTHNLVESLHKVKIFIGASAVGIYGNRGDEPMTETSELGNDFLSKVCVDWESESFKAEKKGARVAILRIGMVISAKGGALEKLLPIFKLNLGGKIGNGRQWMSWIHIEDLVNMFVTALETECAGIFNAVSPNPVTNENFTEALADSLKVKAIIPVPEFALKIAMGDLAQLVLSSQKVIPKKMDNFDYKYPDIKNAFENLFNSK